MVCVRDAESESATPDRSDKRASDLTTASWISQESAGFHCKLLQFSCLNDKGLI